MLNRLWLGKFWPMIWIDIPWIYNGRNTYVFCLLKMNVNHIKLEEQDTGLCRNFKAMVGLMPSLEEEPMKKTEEKEEEDEEDDDAFSFASF